MAEQRNWYLVAYDVTDPKRLRKTHKILTAWGKPLQYSLFRVRGTGRELERVRFELAKVLEPDDRLMVLRLCAHCMAALQLNGEPLAPLALDVAPCTIV